MTADNSNIWVSIVDDILHKQGRTRSWLAKRIGLTDSNMSRLMNGKPVYGNTYVTLTDERRRAISDGLEVPEHLIFHSNCTGHPQEGVEPFAEEVAR